MVVKRKVYSSLNPPESVAQISDEPSLTKQSFAADADINTIMERYAKTGYLVDPLNPSTRKPQFDDFSSVPDFQEAQEIVARSCEMFDDLPSKLRDRFNNDPLDLLAFMSDPANHEEAIKLGIVEPKVGKVDVSSDENSVVSKDDVS